MATTSNLVTNNPAGNALNSKMNPPAFNLSPQFKIGASNLSNSLKPSVAPITPQVKSSVQTTTPALSTPNANGSYSGGSVMPALGTGGTPTGSTGLVQAPLTSTGTYTQPTGQAPNQYQVSGGSPAPTATGTTASGASATNQIDPTTGLYVPGTTATGNSSPQVSGGTSATPQASIYNTPTYSGLVGSLANQQNSPYNANSVNAQNGLLGATAGNQYYQNNAQNITNGYTGLINNTLKNSMGQEIGNSTTGTSPVGLGASQAIAGATGSYLSGLAAQEGQQLSGNSQGLQGQSQQQSGYNSAGGLANSQQGNYQGALGTAASDSAPVSQFGVLTSPTTGQAISPDGGLNAAVQGGSIQGAIQGAQAQAAAPGNIAASNTTTAGTAGTQAAAAAYASSYPQVIQLNQALNNVTSAANMTVQNAQGNNVNPFSLAPANATIGSLRTLLSDTGQVTFNSNMANLQSTIKNLYAANGGSTPTDIQDSINKMADGTLSISGLQALVSAAQAEGNLKLQNAKDTATATYNATQSNNGSTANSGQSNGGGGSTSGFGWNG